MCEFLKTFEFSDLVAIGSVILLYLTFERQGKTFQLQKDLAALEKRAKRGEFLPQLKDRLKIATSDEEILGWDTKRDDQLFTFNVEFTVLENAMKVISCDVKSS